MKGAAFRPRTTIVLASLAAALAAAFPAIFPALAAEDLKLRPGVSFTQDLDSGFPILANKIDDVAFDVTLCGTSDANRFV